MALVRHRLQHRQMGGVRLTPMALAFDRSESHTLFRAALMEARLRLSRVVTLFPHQQTRAYGMDSRLIGRFCVAQTTATDKPCARRSIVRWRRTDATTKINPRDAAPAGYRPVAGD